MKIFISKFKWMILSAAVATFLYNMFITDTLITVSCAIVGVQFFIIPYIFLMVLYFSSFSLITWRIHSVNAQTEKREYLETFTE